MTSLNTKNICFLAAFLFLSIVPTLAAVVNSVADCQGFFSQGTPPNIPGVLVNGNILDQNRYKVICQTYENKRRFLTVYDINEKIPVFSAYEYKGRGGGTATESWKIEPQLDENPTKENINMAMQNPQTDYVNQAVNVDYNNELGLDRGHLFPSLHAVDSSEKTSTYTLTNIAPQADTFNQGRWNTMERCIQCIMNYYTNKKMQCFVVVGANKSNNNKLNNKINIPSVMWSAFYCNKENWSRAGAHWDNNVPGAREDLMTMKPVENLKDQLMVDVFPNTNPTYVDEKVIKSCPSICKAQ